MNGPLDRLTVYYDGAARRKGDRGWKVVVPVGPSVVEHVRLRVPETLQLADGTSVSILEVLPFATAIVEKTCGVKPHWAVLPSGQTAVHVIEKEDA